MLLRCAFFRGRIRPGSEEAFSDIVSGRLVSLWTRFPGASEVRVLRQAEADVTEPHFEMVLAIRYPDRDAMERALASEARRESRAVTQELLALFDGDVFHTLFWADEFPLVAAGRTDPDR